MEKEITKRADITWPLHVKKFYYRIMKEYQMEPDGREVLLQACHSLSRCYEAKKILDDQGLVYMTSQGQLRKNPAAEIEKVSRSQFLQAMKILGISDSDTKRDRGGRPPGPVKDLPLP